MPAVMQKNYAFIPVSITDSNCLCDINMNSSLQWKLMSVEFFSSSVGIYLNNDYSRPFLLTSWNTCWVEEQVNFFSYFILGWGIIKYCSLQWLCFDEFSLHMHKTLNHQFRIRLTKALQDPIENKKISDIQYVQQD